jgi:hypothetical protein
MVHEGLTAGVDALATRFSTAVPFRHIVIDDFLEASFADRLLAEFPGFDQARAINENGAVGNKAVHEDLRKLGPAYSTFDDLVQSAGFLALVSAITGIPRLRHDPLHVGGGTHENRDRQGLDAHIDFNRHPVTHDHRRLNLIIYLNHDWPDAWGGVLELHRDPRAADDEIVRISPRFNRAVIFETTEHSWHGFSTICLPEDSRHRSRRSIALYFYSSERPSRELATTHSTIYVDQPLPGRFVAGMALGDEDVQELRDLLSSRDQHIQRLYRDLKAAEVRLETTLRQVGLVRGSLAYRLLNALRRAFLRVFPGRA